MHNPAKVEVEGSKISLSTPNIANKDKKSYIKVTFCNEKKEISKKYFDQIAIF